MKTSELTGAALDWAVAKCEGHSFVLGDTEYEIDGRTYQRGGCSIEHRYSTNWAQGGPIIERENITLRSRHHFGIEDWEAEVMGTGINSFGPTPLIAAMRCFVASKLGDEVNVPEDLT